MRYPPQNVRRGSALPRSPPTTCNMEGAAAHPTDVGPILLADQGNIHTQVTGRTHTPRNQHREGSGFGSLGDHRSKHRIGREEPKLPPRMMTINHLILGITHRTGEGIDITSSRATLLSAQISFIHVPRPPPSKERKVSACADRGRASWRSQWANPNMIGKRDHRSPKPQREL